MKIPGYRYVSMVGIVKIGVVTFIFLYIRVYKQNRVNNGQKTIDIRPHARYNIGNLIRK